MHIVYVHNVCANIDVTMENCPNTLGFIPSLRILSGEFTSFTSFQSLSHPTNQFAQITGCWIQWMNFNHFLAPSTIFDPLCCSVVWCSFVPLLWIVLKIKSGQWSPLFQGVDGSKSVTHTRTDSPNGLLNVQLRHFCNPKKGDKTRRRGKRKGANHGIWIKIQSNHPGCGGDRMTD